ncbi:MAG TPA: hypothetical protein VKE74_34235 [Gemmataceae bacterium]|nr:hypothetical protein [Gemmataceae bacterium]
MSERIDRRKFIGASVAAAVGGPALFAQQPNPGERNVDPVDLALDKPGVWTLHFRYKTPRIVTIPMIDKVKNQKIDKTVWYLFYQVYNRTDAPVIFLPKFELITKDLNTVHLDEPQPFIVDQIRKIEDPESVLKPPIQTSVDIARRPIPVTLNESIPRLVSGVAVWTDMAERAPKTNKFSIYVTGLSNGLATEEPKSGGKFIKEKVLRLDFIRPTDDANPNPTDIRLDMTNNQPETWLYRTVRPLTEKPKGPGDN